VVRKSAEGSLKKAKKEKKNGTGVIAGIDGTVSFVRRKNNGSSRRIRTAPLKRMRKQRGINVLRHTVHQGIDDPNYSDR